MSHVFTLVLAGGSGTRFWPASRKKRPKQVLGMGPDPSLPLIGHTLRRVTSLCPESQMIVATGESLMHDPKVIELYLGTLAKAQ